MKEENQCVAEAHEDEREAFDAAFLSANGFHTKAELAAEWEKGLSGVMFRAGLAANEQPKHTADTQPQQDGEAPRLPSHVIHAITAYGDERADENCTYPKCSYPCMRLPDCRDAEEKARQAEPQPAEFCWLVELFLGDGTGNSLGWYHTGFTDLHGNSRSTQNPLKAKRYSTWREANLVSVKLGHTLQGTWRAVEHCFVSHVPVQGSDQ